MFKNVKIEKSVDSPGVEPGRFGVSDHPSEPAEPTLRRILPQAQAQAQAGFIVQTLMVLLLVAGIGLGTYLVQQRTNLSPKAARQLASCENGRTLAGESDRTKGDFTAAYCGGASTTQFCDDALEQWAIQHDKDLADQGNPCGRSQSTVDAKCKLGSQSPAVSSTCANLLDNKDSNLIDNIKKSAGDTSNCSRAQLVSYWCNGGLGSGAKTDCENRKKNASACGGSGNGGGPAGSTGGGNGTNPAGGTQNTSGSQNAVGVSGGSQVCSETTTQAYFDDKVANRYARYLAITKGIPEYCVQADLGVDPAILEDSAEGNVKANLATGDGRLYLCSGKAKSDNSKPELLWRVISADGQRIETSRRGAGAQTLEQVNAVMGSHVKDAEKKLRINQ